MTPLFFTGLRCQEAAKLRRDQIDFRARTLTITDTKNHEAHTPPLSDHLLNLLHRNLESTTSNAKSQNANEVTAGYIIADAERLRKPMQQITDVSLMRVVDTISI